CELARLGDGDRALHAWVDGAHVVVGTRLRELETERGAREERRRADEPRTGEAAGVRAARLVAVRRVNPWIERCLVGRLERHGVRFVCGLVCPGDRPAGLDGDDLRIEG